jgi:hypothetical protein
MTFTRRFRLLTVMFSLWALMLSQAAIAAYACPALVKAAEIAAMAHAGMPCAEHMAAEADEAPVALCHGHCQPTPQSADHFQVPTIAAASQIDAILNVAAPVAAPEAIFLQSPLLRRSTAPPLAVQHCCFRI